MADYLTAGTFVGAVLEQSGYLVQSRFLRDFRDFFREAGAFVYLLGGIGAVVSVVLFGSFRMARYLVLGPILYWFLVGPTTTFDGVAWQVGGGAPRDFYRKVVDQGVSAESVQKVIDRSGLNYNGAQVEVAYFFGMYAKVINTVTRDLSLQIINNDDPEYQHAVSKARALEYLTNLEPDNALLKHMFEKNLLLDCMWMTGAALDASGYDLHPEALAAMGGNGTVNKRRRQFDLLNVELGKKDRVALNTTTSPALTQYIQANRGTVPPSITCDEVWKVVAEAITNFSRTVAKPIVMKVAKGNDANEQQVCERIKEKIIKNQDAGAGGGGCDLTNLIAVFVLRNTLANQPVLARMAQWMVNDSQSTGLMSGEGRFNWGAMNLEGLEGAQGVVTGMKRRNFWKSVNPMLQGIETLAANPMIMFQGPTRAARQTEPPQVQREARWSAEARTQSIGGGSDPAFTQMPRYNMRNLRQQLFSWSLQLPFWQGLLLYLLAIAYPFFALVVLLPGRAASFLILPMAWLWVKSWDIGFACVLVFERVLWNMFPSMNINPSLLNRELKDVGIVEAMSEAQRYDHIWNLNMYYTLLSLATLSVPMVMGMMTIKSKRAVLSSFTDKLVQDTKQSGQMAAQSYQMKKAADFSRMREDLSGIAAQIVTKATGGAEGGGRGEQALAQAYMRGGARIPEMAATMMGEGPMGQKAFQTAAELAGGGKRAVGAFADTVVNQAKFDRAEMMAFDPIFGYYGLMQRYAKSYAVAMDTSGGFEISGQNQTGTNAINEFIGLVSGKLESALQAAGDSADGLIHVLGKVDGDGLTVTPVILGAAMFTQLNSLSPEKKQELLQHLDSFAAHIGGLSPEQREGFAGILRERNFDAIPTSLRMADAFLRDNFGDAVADTFFTNALSFTPEAMARYKELQALPQEQRDQTLRTLMPQNYDDLVESINPYTPQYLREVEIMPQAFGETHWVRPTESWWSEADQASGDGRYYPRKSTAPQSPAGPAEPPPAAAPPVLTPPAEEQDLGQIGESIERLPGQKK